MAPSRSRPAAVASRIVRLAWDEQSSVDNMLSEGLGRTWRTIGRSIISSRPSSPFNPSAPRLDDDMMLRICCARAMSRECSQVSETKSDKRDWSIYPSEKEHKRSGWSQLDWDGLLAKDPTLAQRSRSGPRVVTHLCSKSQSSALLGFFPKYA